MTPEQKKHISGLIREFGRNHYAQDLITYVAGSSGVTVVVKTLLTELHGGDGSLNDWLEQECFVRGVDSHSFLRELNMLLNLFTSESHKDDHYSILELSPDATTEDIKKAYRKLSLKYHPDTAGEQQADASEKFIQINRAYHALTDEEYDDSSIAGSDAPRANWRPDKKRSVSPKQRRRVTIVLFSLIAFLLAFSIFATIGYRKQTMLAGLQESRGAFVPPAKIGEQVSQQDEAEDDNSSSKDIDINGTHMISKNNVPKLEERADQANRESKPQLEIEKKAVAESHKVEVVQLEDDGINNEITQNTLSPSRDIENDQVQNQTDVDGKLVKEDATVEKISSNQDEVKKIVSTPDVNNYETSLANTEGPDVNVNEERIANSNILKKQVKKESNEVGLIASANFEGEAIPESVNEATVNSPDDAEPELEKRIDKFVRAYEEAYRQRNIILFSSLFRHDALENEEPFTETLSVYDDLFKALSSASLKVNIITRDNVGNQIHLKGRFAVSLEYKNGEERSGIGEISFTLIEDAANLRVQTLRYSFDG